VSEAREVTSQRGTFEEFLSVIYRQKWIVLTTVGVTIAMLAYLIVSTDPSFRSYSKLLVSRGRPTNSFSSNVRLLSWEEDLSSEMETIRSARIYRRAQELLDEMGVRQVDGTPYKIAPRQISTNTPGRSSIIHILYQDSDSSVVRPVVQTLTRAYQEFRTEGRVPDPSGYLQQEIEGLEEAIAHWEQERADFLVREGAVELPSEQASLLQTKRTIEVNLTNVRAQIAERGARRAWMRSQVDSFDESDVSASLYPVGEADQLGEPALLELRRTLLATKTQYYEARSEYTENHPRVLALRDRLSELRQALRQEAESYVVYLSALVEAARAREASLEASLDYVNEELSAFPDREAQLGRIDRTLDGLRLNHDALQHRRIDAITARMGTQPWDVVVLQEAVSPVPVRTQDYVRLGVIPIFSLLIGLGLAFLVDSLDHSLKDRTEAEAYLKVPVLASVSRFRR